MGQQDTTSNLTILYVDNNLDNGYMLTRRLQRFGVKCIVTTKSVKTVELIIEHSPDLVLLDLNMPYLSGLDVLQQIRQIDAIASIPVWAFTANSINDTREACLEAGFDGFLAKPIMRQDIKDIINRFATQA